MKRFSLLVALSATFVASAAAVNAESLSGSVMSGTGYERDIPLGINETGRFVRFMGDSRMIDGNEIQLSNRDFEDWKPLDGRSKEKMQHFMRGDLVGQSVGRFARYSMNDKFAANNIWLENRDFQDFTVNGASSKARTSSYLRGLSAATNLMPSRSGVIRVGARPMMWY